MEENPYKSSKLVFKLIVEHLNNFDFRGVNECSNVRETSEKSEKNRTLPIHAALHGMASNRS